MTRPTRTALRARTGHGPLGRLESRITRLVRRVFVTSTKGVYWTISGFSDGDGKVETDTVENFEGVGFASRPASGDNTEVITVKVGAESGHPVIIASRSRGAFKVLVAGEGLEEDETAIFTGNSMVKIKADGTIEIGAIGGTRGAVATKADIDALKAIFDAWTPAPNDGGAVLATALAGWTPTGTTKLRAE